MLKRVSNIQHIRIFLTGIIVLGCMASPWMAFPMDENLLPQLVEQLRRDGHAVMDGAEFSTLPVSIQGIIQIGEPALPVLSDLLRDENAWIRWQAVWALKSLAERDLNTQPTLDALNGCVEQDVDPQLHYPCVLALCF